MDTPVDDPPSRSDLLRKGGLYPIPIPLDWKLIGPQGEDVAIPAVAGCPFHRLLAQGALLATEIHPGHPPELMTLRQFRAPGPLTHTTLEQYLRLALDILRQQALAPHVVDSEMLSSALSPHLAAKLVVARAGAGDNRTEVRYLLQDQVTQIWELTYLLRPDNSSKWLPLLAEIDGAHTLSLRA